MYIEVEIIKRKSTDEEKEIVEKFNKKGKEFRNLIFEFHSEDTNRIDKILTIKAMRERIKALSRDLEEEKVILLLY